MSTATNNDATSTMPDSPASLDEWVPLPTETEIYILPNGRVVIADLPLELGPLAEALGTTEACEIVEKDPVAEDPVEADIAPVAAPTKRETKTLLSK